MTDHQICGKPDANYGDCGALPHMQLFPRNARILLVGDGDLAFSVALVDSCLQSMVDLAATAYDSQDELISKYSSAAHRLVRLREAGVDVQFGVDATRLDVSHSSCPAFDRIVFNFPQVPGSKDVVENRVMLTKFLRCAEALLTPNGCIVISNKNVSPYSWWRLEALHEFAGGNLDLAAELPWSQTEYPLLYDGPCNVDRDQGVKAGDAIIFVYAHRDRSASSGLLQKTPTIQRPQHYCCKICRVWPHKAADLRSHKSGKMHRKRMEIEHRWEAAISMSEGVAADSFPNKRQRTKRTE